MKTNRMVRIGATALAASAISFAVNARVLSTHHGVPVAMAAEKPARVSAIPRATPPSAIPLGLPSDDDAKTILDSSIAYHHPQWIDVPLGATKIHTFVIYPTLAGTAPVVVVTANRQGLSDWVRAVGTEVVSQGYIAVVPDLLSGQGPNGGGSFAFANDEAVAAALSQLGASEVQRRTQAVRDYFVSQPGSNGKSAILDFNWPESQLDVAINTPAQHRLVQLDLTEHAWHNTLSLLATLAEPGAMPQQDSAMPKPPNPKDDATEAASAARVRAATQEIAKRKDIVPGHFGGPLKAVEQSPRHGQWISIPVKLSTGTVK